MTTVKFKEANYTNGKVIPAIDELHTNTISGGVKYNYVTTCHRLSLLERLRVLFTGTVWAVRMTDLTILSTEKKDVIV